jgi:hypothetical protein
MTNVKPTRMQKAVVAYCMQLTGHSPVEADETHEVFTLPDSSAENRNGYLRLTNSVSCPYAGLLGKRPNCEWYEYCFFDKTSFKLQ